MHIWKKRLKEALEKAGVTCLFYLSNQEIYAKGVLEPLSTTQTESMLPLGKMPKELRLYTEVLSVFPKKGEQVKVGERFFRLGEIKIYEYQGEQIYLKLQVFAEE